MSSLLQQLENNEAVLLMYLADELPPDDRVEVEQMLATDAGLRAALSRLGTVYAEWEGAMASMDAAERLPVPAAAAAARAARAMRDWQAGRAARRSEPVAPAAGPRFAWWAYPLTAAASILIAAVVWWGQRPNAFPVPESYAHQGEDDFASPPRVYPGMPDGARDLLGSLTWAEAAAPDQLAMADWSDIFALRDDADNAAPLQDDAAE